MQLDELLHDPIAFYPAATVACFDPTTGPLPRRRLDSERTRRYLEQLATAGAPALLIAASTGHGHLRTFPELEEWFRVAASARLGSTQLMALLRPEDGLDAVTELLDLLRTLGYPLVFFRPGTDEGLTDEAARMADHLRPFVIAAGERGLAVGLYSIPDVSGVRLTPDAAARLVEDGDCGPHLVAIKVTEADYEASTRAFLQHPSLQRLKIVQGWDPHLSRALQEGPRWEVHGRQRCGVTSGPMSFAVHQYLHLLDAAEAGDWEEVAASQQAVTVLFEAMQEDPRKFADLQRAKYIMGLGHPLTGEAREDTVERVLTALESLPRTDDRRRLAESLNLMGDGPYADRLTAWSAGS